MRTTLFIPLFLFCFLAKAQKQFIVPVTDDNYYQNSSPLSQTIKIPVKKGDQLIITPKIVTPKHKHYLLNGLLKSIGTGFLTYKTTKTITETDKQQVQVAHKGIGLSFATGIAAGTPDYIRAFKHRHYPGAMYSFYNQNKELVSNHIIKLKSKSKKSESIIAPQDGYLQVRLINNGSVLPSGYFDVKLTSHGNKNNSSNQPGTNSFGNDDPIDPDFGEDPDMVVNIGGVWYSFFDNNGDGYMDQVGWDSGSGVAIMSLTTPFVDQSNYEMVMSYYNPYAWNNNVDDYLTWYQQEYNEPPSSTAITNSLTNPCLRQLFDQLKNGALKDLLIAYTGSEHNLTVQNGQGLPSTVLAQTGPGNDNNNIDMKLNEALLITGSTEAAAETMLHEAIHAYFMGTYSSTNYDHTAMLTNYATSMISQMQSIFPNLSYLDAAALVYSGCDAMPGMTGQEVAVLDSARANLLNIIQQHEANGPNAGAVSDYNLRFINYMYRSSGYQNIGTRFPSTGC